MTDTEKLAKSLGAACADVFTQMQEAGAPVGRLLLEDCQVAGEDGKTLGSVLLVLVVGEQAQDYVKLIDAYESEPDEAR